MSVRGPCGVLGCPNKGTHTFPQNETLRRKWIHATKVEHQRKIGWNLRKYSSICSEHFKQSDFIVPLTITAGFAKARRLKNNAIPSIFPWTSHNEGETSAPTPHNEGESFALSFDPKQVNKTYCMPVLPMAFVEEIPFYESTLCDDDSPMDPLKSTDNFPVGNDECVIDSVHSEVVIEPSNTGEHLNTGICSENFEMKQEELGHPPSPLKSDKCIQTNNDSNAPFSIHNYKYDDKAIHFYTGLETFRKVLLVFETLGQDVSKLNYFYKVSPKQVSPLDQFFITLIILRRHKTFQEMSFMFRISIKQVYNILITWVRFMALQWRTLDLWVDRETVHAYAPLDFYDKYPMTRVVLDATEFPIKKPKLPLAQQITFSTYKNRNTMKALIGISPSGLITYVSQYYGGSATDRQIIERSSILHRFSFKDEIMVDKGLNVQDIFLGYGVKVNMPSFFKKSNQINPTTLLSDRKVASKRVHVERLIGMLKTYKILNQPMNKTETMLSSDIVFICAMLVNFRSNIIKNTA